VVHSPRKTSINTPNKSWSSLTKHTANTGKDDEITKAKAIVGNIGNAFPALIPVAINLAIRQWGSDQAKQYYEPGMFSAESHPLIRRR
jgi:hypothetical protein